MARLRQLESKKETIGDYTFYIKPFPAMVATELTGDLASMLTPVIAALIPLVGSSTEDGSEAADNGLMDMDVNAAAAAMAKGMEGFSGAKVVMMMKKLLIIHKNIAVEMPEYDEDDVATGEYTQEILDMDILNEIFCGEVQDMFILAFYVIRLNFNGFFKKLVGRFGKAGEALQQKMRTIL